MEFAGFEFKIISNLLMRLNARDPLLQKAARSALLKMSHLKYMDYSSQIIRIMTSKNKDETDSELNFYLKSKNGNQLQIKKL